MIFDIEESVDGEVMFVEQQYGDAYDAAMLIEDPDVLLACADGYENCLIFL